MENGVANDSMASTSIIGSGSCPGADLDSRGSGSASLMEPLDPNLSRVPSLAALLPGHLRKQLNTLDLSPTCDIFALVVPEFDSFCTFRSFSRFAGRPHESCDSPFCAARVTSSCKEDFSFGDDFFGCRSTQPKSPLPLQLRPLFSVS